MRTILVLILIMLGSNPTTAFASQPAQHKVASYVLENGLQLVVIPDRRAPVVTHSIWYKVGAADDPPGKSGIAHFVEHLMFKGTKKHPQGEFSLAVAQVGGQENAFTSADYTGYYQKVSPQALRQMMAFEADRMRNLTLTDDVVRPELQVILEERSSRVDNSPGAILSEFNQSALFVHHPYGTPIVGWEHEIRQLTRADAIAFYDRWYRPANAVVVVAGDVNAEDVFTIALETYGAIVGEDGPVNVERLREPPPVAEKSITYRDARVTTPSWQRSFHAPSYMTAQPGEAEALDLLSAILGGSATSRLRKSLVLDDQIATSAGAYYQGASRDDGYFGLYATPRDETDIAVIEAAVEAELKKLLEEGVTQVELDRQRESFLRSEIFSRDSQTSLVRIYGATLAIGGSVDDVASWADRLKAVTIQDINRVGQKYLKNRQAVTSYLLPEEG